MSLESSIIDPEEQRSKVSSLINGGLRLRVSSSQDEAELKRGRDSGYSLRPLTIQNKQNIKEEDVYIVSSQKEKLSKGTRKNRDRHQKKKETGQNQRINE